MKAMLLAAGRGERMRHLTDKLPKPLLSVGSKTLIEHNLERLKMAGIKEVVINVSYRGDQIIEKLSDGKHLGMKITYSHELGSPLGTGGGVFQALKFLGKEPFLILSSDIWTDYPFEKLKNVPACDGHLILVENPSFHPKGDYCLLESGKVSAKATPKFTYASFALIHPNLFKDCQAGCYSISPLLEAAMKNSTITGEVYYGEWYNVGTPEELKRLRSSQQVSS